MSDKNDRGDLKIRYLWLLPIVLELFVCNALFWTDRVTGGEPEKNLILSSFQAEGLAQTEAGGNIFQFTEGEEHYLEFTQIDQEVRSIYLDFALEKDTGAAESFSCSLFASDDGDASYYPIPSDRIKHVVVPDVAATKWLRTRFYGRLQKLKIQFDPGQVNPGDSLVLSAVSINRPRKLRISILRILGMELLVVLICLFQRGSRFYGWSYAERGRIHKVCIGAVLAVQLALLVLMFYTVKPYVETSLTVGGSHEQYQKLAEAIADGHVYLNDQVPEWLKQMENPYDRNERGRLAAETGEPYLWDNVYYNGHYYVYFGIVPVLLAYLPYYLIFHAALPNTAPIYICWFVICAAFARLAGTVIRKWFPSFPYILYVCIAAVLPFGIGSIAVLHRPTIYEVPISMGVMFAVLGLDLWLESVQDGEIRSIPKMAAGSLCIALVAGCRPNMMLVFLFSFLIFGEVCFHRKGWLRRFWKEMVVFCVPFLIVAAGLMYYNQIRFGSVFDFGSNYNLTSDDLTRRGFDVGKIGLGLFEMFWKPFALTTRFPFLKIQTVESAYMGKTICCSNTGGILALCPFFLLPVLVLIQRKRFQNDRWLLYFVYAALLSAVLICAVDVTVAGIYPRYKADFSFFMAFAGLLCIGMTDARLSADARDAARLSVFRTAVFWICMAVAFLSFFSFFVTLEYSLYTANPRCFYNVKYLFEFWN